MPLPACHRGFTLLEVLVAFVITALALGVLYQIYAKGTTAVILGEDYAEAITIAESRLALLGTEVTLDNKTLNGSDHKKYDWRVAVKDYVEAVAPTTLAQPPLALKEIELEVTWQSLGKQRSVLLHTLRPAAPKP